MVFSMPASANNNGSQSYLAGWLLVMAMLMLPSQTVEAVGIEVRNVSTVQVRGQVILHARLDFELSEEALKALEHGIAIDLVIDMGAVRKRRWLWDKNIVDHSERYRLERQALSKHYVVVHDYRRQSFLSLQEALEYIGNIRDYPLLKTSQLESGQRYQGRLRAWLDIESLPAPMRPTAHISSHWHIASGWREWPIEP